MKHDTEEPPEAQGGNRLDEGVLNPEKLKGIFDKMTEIDTNPSARASKEFHKQLEDIERKNTHKRQGQITIKTIRRGRVRKVTEERFETDSAGRIKMLDKRLIRYQEYDFPMDRNPIDDFYVTEGSQKIKI